MIDRNTLALMVVFAGLMAMLGSITKVALTLIQRRRSAPDAALGSALDEISRRLERLEQAVDATAVEVERIAEGQRFTTRLLGERAPSAAASPEPARPRVVTPH